MTLSSEQKNQIESWVHDLQARICSSYEEIEKESDSSARFTHKRWEREGGGIGNMRVMRGKIFEKVGVNVSTTHGPVTDKMRDLIPNFTGNVFWACGISLVSHMSSPKVPIVHMNTRVMGTEEGYWFGGGADLTPVFPFDEDTNEFHEVFRKICEDYEQGSYLRFKEECDRYFFLKHRNEPRGVGGIFYDYLRGSSFDKDFRFMRDVGEGFLHIYPKIVRRRLGETWDQTDKRAQLIKRGRYAEFNLVYDRGTKFGFITGANTEAFLMSLPPEVMWV